MNILKKFLSRNQAEANLKAGADLKEKVTQLKLQVKELQDKLEEKERILKDIDENFLDWYLKENEQVANEKQPSSEPATKPTYKADITDQEALQIIKELN